MGNMSANMFAICSQNPKGFSIYSMQGMNAEHYKKVYLSGTLLFYWGLIVF